MSLTKNNHFNPCFWTAFWSKDYYQQKISGKASNLTARKQSVYSLNIRANKIFQTSVANVHYDKGIGQAEITAESALAYCKEAFPADYLSFAKKHDPNDYPLIMDFESFLTGTEHLAPYTTLREVVVNGDLRHREDKVNLGCFLIIQQMRGHAILNAMVEATEFIGQPKWRHFLFFRHILSNPDSLMQLISPIIFSKWLLHRTQTHSFPLCDSPILIQSGRLMAALSPHLLLEVNMTQPSDPGEWQTRDGIHKSKLKEYMRRTIGNTFKEIIFSDIDVLETWRNTDEFRQRVKKIADMETFNRIVTDQLGREIYHINAYGNSKSVNGMTGGVATPKG